MELVAKAASVVDWAGRLSDSGRPPLPPAPQGPLAIPWAWTAEPGPTDSLRSEIGQSTFGARQPTAP